MLRISNLRKHYGDTLLFDKVNLTINTGDRLGLVGPNGCGKTTLLRILVGEEKPDQGSVQHTAPNVRIGYLQQALVYDEEATVKETLSNARELGADHWAAEVQALAEHLALASANERDTLEHAYNTALEQLALTGEQLPDHVVERILAGLGMDHVGPMTPVRILSGGQKTRLGLARLLLSNPSLLLLDEPTNHLDIAALEWLEGYLNQYKGAVLIVSHDRTFLDRTVTRILAFDATAHTIREYEGNYTAYLQSRERELEKARAAYQDQQDRIAQLESAIDEWKGHAKSIEQTTIHFHPRAKAKKIAHQAVIRQRRIQRLLDSEERLDKPKLTWDMKLEFVQTPPSGQDVIVLEDVAKRYGERTLFEGVNLVLRRGERIALIGPNGSGKTTLLRLIIGREPASSGVIRLGANVQVGYFSQEQESLDWSLTPLQTVQKVASLGETEARHFLHFFLFAGDDVFTPVSSLSYGERARLALGVLVLQGCNLLLLDEPINHLDIPSRENFEQALASFEGAVLAGVHDRYFIEHFASGIWAIEKGEIRRHIDLEDAHRNRAQWSQQ